MLLLVMFLFMVMLYFWLDSKPFYWRGKGINWMIPLPILGNTGGSLTKPYIDFWLDFYRSCEGPLFGYHFFKHPALLVKDPELVKQVMVSDADNFTSHGFFISEKDVFRRSILAVDGDEWRTTRSKLSPHFSPSKIKSMMSIIDSTVDNYVHHIEMESKKGYVEIDGVSKMLSTDVIVSNAFGMEPDCLTNPKSFFCSLQKEMAGFQLGLKVLIGILTPKISNALNLTFFSRRTNKDMTYFVNQAVEARLKGESIRPDIMQGFVELYAKDRSAEPIDKYNSDGTRFPVFDKETITAQMLTLFFAGTETSAHTLSFTFYELAKDQSVQDRLRQEIKEFKNGEIFQYEDFGRMTYLDMVLSEVMRLHTVISTIPRRCTKATRLASLDIPKGVYVVISVVGLHMDSNYYPNPNKFDPERFGPGVPRTPGTYFPFGMGPRTCLGMKLAEIEMKLALCKVLSQFKVLTCSKTSIPLRKGFGPASGPRDGIYLEFHKLT